MDSPFLFKLSDLDIRLRKSNMSPRHMQKTPTFWLIIAFLSTSIGIGFTSMPLATAHVGIPLFIILVLLCAFLKYHANLALYKTGLKLKAKNYPLLVKKLFKNSIWAKGFNLLMFFNVFGIMITYTLAIQQSLTAALSHTITLFHLNIPAMLGRLNS